MDTQEMGTQRGEIICQGYPVSSNAWTRVQVFSSFFLCDSPLILIYLFYWRINASQDWTGFCWTAVWISSLSLPHSLSCSLTLTHSLCLSLSPFTHTHTHPPEHPSHLPTPCYPLSQHRAPSWGPCAIRRLPTSYLFHTWWCIHADSSSQVIPPFLPPLFHKSNLHVCVSVPALQIGFLTLSSRLFLLPFPSLPLSPDQFII